MKSILVTGDATERTEDKILEFHEDEWLRSEVYKTLSFAKIPSAWN